MKNGLVGEGALFYCPNCMTELPRALPVEPLFTREETARLVPCLLRWLKLHQNDPGMSEPVYIKDHRRRVHRMFPARDIRFLREKRLAKYTAPNRSHKK